LNYSKTIKKGAIFKNCTFFNTKKPGFFRFFHKKHQKKFHFSTKTQYF